MTHISIDAVSPWYWIRTKAAELRQHILPCSGLVLLPGGKKTKKRTRYSRLWLQVNCFCCCCCCLFVDRFGAGPFLGAIILSVFESLLSVHAMLQSTFPSLAASLNCGIAASTAEAALACQLPVPSQTLAAVQPVPPTHWSSCWQISTHLCSLPHLAVLVGFMLLAASSNVKHCAVVFWSRRLCTPCSTLSDKI